MGERKIKSWCHHHCNPLIQNKFMNSSCCRRPDLLEALTKTRGFEVSHEPFVSHYLAALSSSTPAPIKPHDLCLRPSHSPTGRQRPEHESDDGEEDVFPIAWHNACFKRQYTQSQQQMDFHTRSDDSLEEDSDGKKSTGDQSISYDTINMTTPASACAFVQVCLHVWEMSCWQQTAVTMSANEGSSTRGHANTLSVRPRVPRHPFYDWEMTDRVFMLMAVKLTRYSDLSAKC